jgi:membrane protease YdiL (CAAX protease family)
LGLGKPLEIKSLLEKSDKSQKQQLIVLVIVLGAIYNYMTLPNWSLVLIRFGLRGRNPELFRFLTQTTEGTIIAILTGILTYLVLVFFLIRWDNFISSAKVLIPFGALFCLGIVVTGMVYAMIDNDWSLFENFRWISQDSDSFLTHASFYTMWGMVQQYLFLSYFNTRFRKGFDNSKKGQFLCALCTGLCFGLIHMPFLPLSTLTFIGGFLYAYFFGKDKYRNLFIMGIAHGFGGTLVSMLTPMVMVVGPWGI